MAFNGTTLEITTLGRVDSAKQLFNPDTEENRR
jgi:hypothetical protein